MTQETPHSQIEELLGAFALDAVDPDEMLAVEDHLRSCPRCAAEVSDHREVAALMANSGAPAPEGVWSRIVESLEEQPPELVLPSSTRDGVSETSASSEPAVSLADHRARRSTSVPRRWLPVGAAAAAAVLVVGVFIGNAIGSDGGGGEVDLASVTIDDVAERAFRDTEARQVTMTSPDGRLSAPVAIDVDGSAYLLGSTLPPLSRAETYQLWGVTDDQVISLGVIGPDPDVVAFHVDGATTALAITREVAGGVVSSENSALMVVELT